MLVLPTAVAAAPPRAVLDGRWIALRDVARHHCHDGAPPTIRCFTARGSRDQDARKLAVTYYVELFEHEGYGGSSMMASANIGNLGSYGWNDRATSFRSLNGGRPKYWENNAYAGGAWQWAAGAWVSNVGSGANDRFSSVKNVP